jgi:hypothetical protein
MTREELVNIMWDTITTSIDDELRHLDLAADRILSALEAEKKGEVVLEEGVMGEDFMMEATCNSIELNGKRGQLIFREEK